MHKTITFNTTQTDHLNQSSCTNNTGSKEVTWDEDTIKLHNLERGTRQRIDEPKTPFSRSFQYPNSSSTTQNTLSNSQQTEQQSIPVLNLCEAIHSMDFNYISPDSSHSINHANFNDEDQVEEWWSNPQLFNGCKLLKRKHVQVNF